MERRAELKRRVRWGVGFEGYEGCGKGGGGGERMLCALRIFVIRNWERRSWDIE